MNFRVLFYFINLKNAYKTNGEAHFIVGKDYNNVSARLRESLNKDYKP